MRELNKFKKIILVPLLILNLAVFNFPVLSALAEGEETDSGQTETTVAEENNTNNEQADPQNNNSDEVLPDTDTVIDTGDANVEVEVENEVNTNITEFEETIPPVEEVIEEILSNEADLSFVIEPVEPNDLPVAEDPDLTGATITEEIIPTEEATTTDEAVPLDDATTTESGTTTEEIIPTEEATTTDETALLESATSTEPATTTEESSEGECSCQEPPEPCEDCQCDCKLEVDNENEAVIENNLEIEGESGENVIEESSGDSLIDTGDVNIAVGVVNMANSNITESEFSNSLLNIFEKLDGNINLESQFEPYSSNQNNCSGNNKCLEVRNENSGEIENNLLIDGSSGGNSAESVNGNSTIRTGDVNVSASVFNLLNTNIIGSNWRNFIINIFGDWTGDLIFPGKAKMQEFLNHSSSPGSSCAQNCDVSIDNSNEGQIENEVSISADTGSNTAQGNVTIIRTGGANATANIFNLANTNVFGGNWFFIAINHFGKWKGNLYSLPPELGTSENSYGIKIYNLDAEEFGSQASASGAVSGAIEVVNNNTGAIKNSIIVNVSSGDNTAIANNGQATIETGDANVFTNLVNILNTNITGSNWLLGMINIFGDWEGNIAFGRPDLLIAESAVTSNTPALPGGLITYTLNYFNNGDADATGVRIIDDFDEGLLFVADAADGQVKDNPGEIEWNIGNVPVGGSGSVSYSVTISSDIPYGTTYITNHATIESLEEDSNKQNNTDTLSVEVYRASLIPVSQSIYFSLLPYLQVSKTCKNDSVLIGDNLDCEIVLTNNVFGPAYDVVVEDILYNESSEIINTNRWDLGEVASYEKIIIDYTVNIGEEIVPGFYTNVAKAQGRGGDIVVPVSSNEASFTIKIKAFDEDEEPGSGGEAGREEISLEEMENQVNEIGGKIEKIREEIKRLLPPEPEPSSENLLNQVSEILVPPVSAQEENVLSENKPQTVQNRAGTSLGLAKLLAAIGEMPFSLRLILVILGFAILVLIILRLFRRRKRE